MAESGKANGQRGYRPRRTLKAMLFLHQALAHRQPVGRRVGG